MSILNSAAAVLQLMSRLKRSVTVSDVVEHLGYPKSTASRLLKQLSETGFLDRDSRTLAYQPSLLLLEVTYLVRHNSNLSDHIEQVLQRLCQQTGHTGYISMLSGHDVLVLRVVPGVHALRVITHPGTRSPAWGTSTGRALLAYLPESELARQYRPVLAPEKAAAMSFAALEEKVRVIAQRQWASAVDESVPGAASVSCAVSDPHSGETLAFCLTFPSSIADEQEIANLAELVSQAARQVGKTVGDPRWLTGDYVAE
ncbi:IclR family transcriptional regulator [Musicola paradisiaca]|uniref:Transcriptional regulator, IclR family n=1 Tax=Musicola paradisiaca (strain Ech703) TaxID=579405 RepID=C6C7G3_MUSP7|nr:IclR family transcriptional regulator [Musicola paradisiaca]ACS84081.1 transcriptional regulator, IclR family [Musicola paradisiaca Ech703]